MRFLTLRNVLVAVELDDPALPAVLTGAQLAAAAGATLHVISVVDASTKDGTNAPVRTKLAEIFRRAGVENPTIHAVSGDPSLAIGLFADSIPAQVIVLGPHRAGRSDDRAIGGTAMTVVTNAWSPCLVATTTLRLPLRKVLVPVDLSDTARGALLVALSWASALRTPSHGKAVGEVMLTALHVVRALGGAFPPTPLAIESELAQLRNAGQRWAGVSIRAETIASTDAAKGIEAYVADHDLVVMGTRGLGLDAAGRLGSVAAAVSRSIQVPTLLVPPAVWHAYAGWQHDAELNSDSVFSP